MTKDTVCLSSEIDLSECHLICLNCTYRLLLSHWCHHARSC